MAVSTARTNGERFYIIGFGGEYVLGPDAKPGIVSHHNEIIVPAAAELNGAFEAHRAADIDVDDASEVVGVSDKGLDDICERIDLTVRLNFGDAAVEELHAAWGHRTRSQLVILPHLRQVDALDNFVLRLPGVKLFTLDPALVAELKLAIDALRDAVGRKQRAITVRAGCAARLSEAAAAFDAAWSRMVKYATFVLGADVGLYVPDLSDFRRKRKTTEVGEEG